MKSLTASDKSRVVPKKFFVVMPFGSEEYSAKPTRDIAAGVLDGVLGISDKAEIIMQWYGMARDAILAMDGPELVRLNSLSRIQYDNPEYLVSKGLAALYRLFAKQRTKSGSYSLAANLIDHILIGIKTGKAPGAEVLSEAKDLADTIEKHAEALRRSLKALPFEDKYDLRQAVKAVTGRRMDESDIENFAGFSGRAVKNLTEFSTNYAGLGERLIKLYLDSYDMEPGDSAREVAALAPKAEAAALDYGWDANQTEALVKIMADFATLVQDFDAIKALSKKASNEVASLSGDGAISYALSYDRGRALEKSFGDHGTDDIKTVKGLAKRFAEVFKDGGHDYRGITITAWERAIRKALKSIGQTFNDEGEWLVKDRKLKIPPKSTLWISKYPLPEDVEARRKAGETTKRDDFVHSSHIKGNNTMDRMIKDLNLGQRYIVRRVEKRKFDEAKSKWAVRPSKLAASTTELFHTTSIQGLQGILQSGELRGHPFVSLSEIPYIGDISFNDVTMVFDAATFGDKIEKVEYTKKWYDKHGEQASYIAGDGWIEQYQAPEDCFDEEGWEDSDCSDLAYKEAEFDSFRYKDKEQEWLGKRRGDLPFPKEAVLRVIVHKDRALAMVEEVLNSLGYAAEAVGAQVSALSASVENAPKEFRLMFHLPSQQVPDLGEQLARGVLKGISGVTDAGPVLQLRMFSVNRNAMLIMPGQKTLQLNDMQPVAYSDPESLMADDMAVAQRLLGQGWDKRKVITRILQEAEKGPMKDWMRSWQRLDVFPEEEMASQPLNSVEDMAEAMFDLSKPKVEAAIERNKDLGEEFVKDRYDPLLDFENYFKAVRSGLSNLGKGFVWEGEWLVADKTLHIPAGSRLVILDKKPNSDKAKKLLEEHNLDKRYRIQYADPAKMERATHWLGRHAEKATKERWNED